MRLRALAAVGLAAAVLTACHAGSFADAVAAPTATSRSSSPSQPKAGDIAAQAADVLEHAGAVRLQGEVAPVDGDPARLDLHLQGADATGTMVLPQGQTLQLIETGSAVYLQGPAAYWAGQGVAKTTAARLAGVWVRLPDAAAREFSAYNLPALVEDLRHPTAEFFERPNVDQLDGQRVWKLDSTDGSHLWVAAEGTPYPLEVTGPTHLNGTFATTDYTLSEFGALQQIAAPAKFLDLGGGQGA